MKCSAKTSDVKVGLNVYYRSDLIQKVMTTFKSRSYGEGKSQFVFSHVTVLPCQDGKPVYIDVYFQTRYLEEVDKPVLTAILRDLINDLSGLIETEVGWLLEFDGVAWPISHYAGQYPEAKESLLVHEHQVMLQLVSPSLFGHVENIIRPTRVEMYDLSIGQPSFLQYSWGYEVFFSVRNEGEFFASSSRHELWSLIQNMLQLLSHQSGSEVEFNCFIDGEAMQSPPEYVYETIEFVYIEPVVVYSYYDPFPGVIIIV